MKEERVFFPSGGIQLEGLLNIQEALSVKGGMILCHPHPQFGGDMDNTVISIAAEAAWQEGFSTLRFNFRGVGESEGSYGDGIGEQEDVKAAIDFFSARQNDPHWFLIVLGYSFGAWTGIPAAIEDERVKGMVAISPPLELYSFEFMKGCKKEKLIIVGDQDMWCPSERLEKWYQKLDEPKSLTLIQGTDHFFSYHIQYLIKPLGEFFRKCRK